MSEWAPIFAAGSALMVEWLQPLNVVLLVALVMFARYMGKANARADFSLVDALRGPDGKASMKLIGYLVGVIFGTWALMNCAAGWLQQPLNFVYVFVAYLALLVAPKIVAELIQAKYGDRNRPPEQKENDR